MSFDITAWHKYRPTREMCVHCYATYRTAYWPRQVARHPLDWLGTAEDKRKCRICAFVHDDDWFVETRDAESEPNLKELARIGSWLPPHTKPGSMLVEPLALLFRAISSAKWYIHFVTYSIDSTVLGALQMASLNVKVRGIVGNLNSFNRDALESLDGLDARNASASLAIMTSTTKTPMIDAMHNKMLFIDGVLAIKGSANLSLSGYTKASRKSLMESIEAVTVPDDVAELHNTYFSRVWAQNSRPLTRDEATGF